MQIGKYRLEALKEQLPIQGMQQMLMRQNHQGCSLGPIDQYQSPFHLKYFLKLPADQLQKLKKQIQNLQQSLNYHFY